MQIRQLVVDIGTNGAVAEFSGGKLTVTGIEPGQLFAALGEIEKIIAPKKDEPKRSAIDPNGIGLELKWDANGASIRDPKVIVGVDMASGPDKTVTMRREAAPEAKPALEGNGALTFLKEEAAKIQPAAVEPPRREAKPVEAPVRAEVSEAKPAEPHARHFIEQKAAKPENTVPAQAKPARVVDKPAPEAPKPQPADDAPSEDDDSPEALDARLKASAQRDAEWKAKLAEKEAERAKGPVRDALKKEDPAALVEALRNTPRPTPPPPKPAPVPEKAEGIPRVVAVLQDSARGAQPPAQASNGDPADNEPADEDDAPEAGAIRNFGVEEREYVTMNAAVRGLVQANRGKPILEDVDALAVAFLPFCRKWIKPIRELPEEGVTVYWPSFGPDAGDNQVNGVDVGYYPTLLPVLLKQGLLHLTREAAAAHAAALVSITALK
jgi:hypothetical protein